MLDSCGRLIHICEGSKCIAPSAQFLSILDHSWFRLQRVKLPSLFTFRSPIEDQSFELYCKVTRTTAVLSVTTLSDNVLLPVLARSTMFFYAILYRRQIWIVERSCCARNWQLRRWAPKGLFRIYVEQQQLPSLSPLKGIRQEPVSALVRDPSSPLCC